MDRPTLFHLHFNAPDVEGAAERLARAGIPLRRRFGSVRGEGVSLDPDAEAPDGFRFKLQVHRRGGVDVTLAPGGAPRFDHLGLVVEDFEDALGRAEAAGWSVRRNDRRTFATTPWGFRVEVHPADGDVAAGLGSFSEAHLGDATLRLPDADGARAAFADAFGPIPELRFESGEGPWLESFELVTGSSRRDVIARDLLEE